MEREAGDGVRPSVWELRWAGQTVPPLLNKQICVQHRPCVPGVGEATKVAFVKRDEYLVMTILGVLYYPSPDQKPASSYQYQSAIASRGTTPGLSRARRLLCWLITQIPFPGMKECITCSKGCIKYRAREALGGSRKPPWIQAPALGLYPQSRPMLRA